MSLAITLWTFLRALVGGATTIALENAALRYQLTVLQRSGRRPRLTRWDRIGWGWRSRFWVGWRSSLDRDAIYGEVFTQCVDHTGIRQVTIAPRAPWQKPFCRVGDRLHPPRVPRPRGRPG